MTDAFCFTINNYTEEDLQAVYKIKEPYYVLFGKEVGASGTPHLQGMIWREDQVRARRDRIEKLLGGRAHLEPCKNLVCSMAYCTKDFDIYCNVCHDLEPLVRTLNRLTSCREFIGICIYNHMFGTEYDLPFIYTCFHHHKNLCNFCKKQ